MKTSEPFLGMVMILVEDDTLLRESIAMFFRIKGFHVLAFGSAEEALAAVESGRSDFDITVSDYLLPGADGLSLLNRIGALRPGTLRILITAYASAELIHEAREGGIDDVFPKPFTPDALEDSLRQLFRRREELAGGCR